MPGAYFLCGVSMAEFIQNGEAHETAFDGCPDPTSGRAIIIEAGAIIPGDANPTASICHQLRSSSGSPIDLSSYDPSNEANDFSGKIPNGIDSIVLFQNALCGSDLPLSSPVVFSDPDNGRICVKLPPQIAANPGIYRAEIVIADTAGRPAIKDDVLLSVERSLLSQHLNGTTSTDYGPITLGEIRTQLRDYPALNTAWETAEFSDNEIVHSILMPIRAFNEVQPRVLRYTANNFPYRYQWLEATTANLLRLAGNWYLRNAQRLAYGDGKTQDDKDKVVQYMQIAETKWNTYLQFADIEQITANMRGYSSF